MAGRLRLLMLVARLFGRLSGKQTVGCSQRRPSSCTASGGSAENRTCFELSVLLAAVGGLSLQRCSTLLVEL